MAEARDHDHLAFVARPTPGRRRAIISIIRGATDDAPMEVKSRHHLRSDEIRELETTLEDALGVDLDGDAYERVDLVDTEFDLVLVDGEPHVFFVDGEPFLTVRGANAHPPQRRVVTVDAGAVQFVSDGADVMRPGIVDADDAIAPGDLVAIVEETHRKALAVGRALEPGSDLVGDSGKVVESVHHVGDDLYEFAV
jgi:PUA-domain protein